MREEEHRKGGEKKISPRDRRHRRSVRRAEAPALLGALAETRGGGPVVRRTGGARTENNLCHSAEHSGRGDAGVSDRVERLQRRLRRRCCGHGSVSLWLATGSTILAMAGCGLDGKLDSVVSPMRHPMGSSQDR
ncbi:hypothetical protein M6B38_310665 [Iris pallida]|uniref:Uncharacterized protein n=1 Tax=Iris pallida TaxID=29817 RepID=A0AAX6HHX0_IRIPA|nr:hypothetical protein M6B38_310665 [Iris pallida]